MQRRLFIAINIPETVKTTIRQKINNDKEQHADLYANARITPEQHWHITLLFLGDQSEEHRITIEQTMERMVRNTMSPTITLQALTMVSAQQQPHMLWITASQETNKTLAQIRQAIIQGIDKKGIIPKGEIYPQFNGHITILRLPEQYDTHTYTIPFSNMPTFHPTHIELMESIPGREGMAYRVLKSIDFKHTL